MTRFRFSTGKGPEAFSDPLEDDDNDEDDDDDDKTWGKELGIGICPRCSCHL